MMSALGNGPHTPSTRQGQGACHIWQMLGPQMSAARTHIARRADTVLRRYLRLVGLVAENNAEPPGVCVEQRRGHRRPGRQTQLAGGRGSHARPERVSRILCTISNASSVSSLIAR